MPHTQYANHRQRSTARPRACAMIFNSLGHRAEFPFVFHEAMRSTPMMSFDRSKFSCHAILFLVVLIGLPRAVRSATLEDSAKELARKIAAALPAGENVSCEIRNLSSLNPEEAARIDQALRAEFQERGVRLARSVVAITVVVTLSENFKNLVWTAEIHQGDASQVVLVAAERVPEQRAVSNSMPVTIRSEKFWEGPERILDAGEITNGVGKSRLVLLTPNGVLIQDRQTGLIDTIEIVSDQSASRDPSGNLNIELSVDIIGLLLAPQLCSVNLESRVSLAVLPDTSLLWRWNDYRPPRDIRYSAAGSPPPGKGIEVGIRSVCGGTSQFLATGSGDDTQTDSLQVFQAESGRAVAVSAELDFPGPVTALHADFSAPRAVVRNLATGNYEAYRLSFSCGQ